MQLVAFDGKITPPITNGDLLLEKTSSLISLCRVLGLPIIYIQTRAASRRAYAEDAHGWEIHPQLTPHPDDHIVYKANSSGFDGTDLNSLLHQLNVDAVITCGIWSEHCLTNTSLDAVAAGYGVCVVANAHGTVSENENIANGIIERQNNLLASNGVNVMVVNDLKNGLQLHDLVCSGSPQKTGL